MHSDIIKFKNSGFNKHLEGILYTDINEEFLNAEDFIKSKVRHKKFKGFVFGIWVVPLVTFFVPIGVYWIFFCLCVLGAAQFAFFTFFRLALHKSLIGKEKTLRVFYDKFQLVGKEREFFIVFDKIVLDCRKYLKIKDSGSLTEKNFYNSLQLIIFDSEVLLWTGVSGILKALHINTILDTQTSVIHDKYLDIKLAPKKSVEISSNHELELTKLKNETLLFLKYFSDGELSDLVIQEKLERYKALIERFLYRFKPIPEVKEPGSQLELDGESRDDSKAIVESLDFKENNEDAFVIIEGQGQKSYGKKIQAVESNPAFLVSQASLIDELKSKLNIKPYPKPSAKTSSALPEPSSSLTEFQSAVKQSRLFQDLIDSKK